MMRHGCRDFVSGRPVDLMTFFEDSIDIHHVFPKAWCIRHGIAPGRFNSILNKTPLSLLTKRAVGGNAPSAYLRRIEERHGIGSDQLDGIIRTHLIDPAHLRNDDFEAFLAARSVALSRLVEDAMGRAPVGGGLSDEETGAVDPGWAVDEDDSNDALIEESA